MGENRAAWDLAANWIGQASVSCFQKILQPLRSYVLALHDRFKAGVPAALNWAARVVSGGDMAICADDNCQLVTRFGIGFVRAHIVAVATEAITIKTIGKCANLSMWQHVESLFKLKRQRSTDRIIQLLTAHFIQFRDSRILELREFMDSYDAVQQVLGHELSFQNPSECPLWHLADNPAAPAAVRYWTKADKSGLRR